VSKRSRKLTRQEELVTKFISSSISSRSTFHPQQWRNGREPADMIISLGCVLILINMTHGKSYFEDLCEHNIKQAILRINEWRDNRPIRGHNEWRSFSIAWTDVSKIAVISVVDGPHSACTAHDIGNLGLPDKVRICATITSDVIENIAHLGGGARDLIDLCKYMQNHGVISAHSLRLYLQNRFSSIGQIAKIQYPKTPVLINPSIINNRPLSWFEEFMFKFVRLRASTDEQFDVISDLAWTDIIPAIAYMGNVAAEAEFHNKGTIAYKLFGKNPKFLAVLTTNMSSLSKMIHHITQQAKMDGAHFLVIVALSNIGIQTILVFIKSSENLPIEMELE